MEHPSKRQKISRIQGRRPSPADGQLYERQKDSHVVKGLRPRRLSLPFSELDHPLPIMQLGGFPVADIANKPRAITTKDVTVVVSVVAEVDSTGRLIALETLPAVPAVPAFPSDLTVPAVPPFPSDLTVPAVPQATNVVPSVPQITSSSVPSIPKVPALSLPTSLSVPSLSVPSILPSLSIPGVNLPSYISSLTSALASAVKSVESELGLPTSIPSSAAAAAAAAANQTSSAPAVVTPAAVPLSNSTASVQDFSASAAAPVNGSLTLSNTLTSRHSSIFSSHDSRSTVALRTSTVTIGGNFNPAAPAATASSGTGANGQGSGSGISQRTSTVVGGVFGGLAGVALLLVLALLLLRWYKRRRPQQMHRLDDDDVFDAPASRSLPPPMTQIQPQRRSFIPAAAAGLVSRFSAASKDSEVGSPTQERGFQKISGRKLPSAFSGGITEADVQSHRHTLSETSFYRDSRGYYGGSGELAGPSRGADKETLMPSPARTPVIHHPYSAMSSPPHTPLQRPSHEQGSLGRSHPSHDGSRGSRFTENV